MSDEYLEANRARWDELVPIHLTSDFYDVEAFKAGRNTLCSVEQEELGDVAGRRLLHLQCHFGLDTLSWARLGADVTGVDFSPVAVSAARDLASELGISARFICCDVGGLPGALQEEFDIVFTSYGVLCWLGDLGEWARVIAAFLRPGGTFYIVDFHPFACVFDDEAKTLEFRYPYFNPGEPMRFEDDEGSYADPEAHLNTRVVYSWAHSLGEIVDALIESGLTLEFMHEFPFAPEAFRPWLERDGDGLCRLREHQESIPLLFSVKARKPGG